MIEPSGYWLDGVPLWRTRMVWPGNYRGCAFVPCKFWQPHAMFQQLKGLKDKGEAGVTLRFKSAKIGGGHREQVFKGVQVADVVEQKQGIDGCIVVLADRRWRLQFYVMGENWNILYQGQYLQGTAKARLVPYKLKEALEILAVQKPFIGYMRSDWRTPLNRLPDDAYVPDDLLFAGQNLTKMLEKMLDHWGFDLSVDTEGKFYFADRGVSNTGDPGLAKVRGLYTGLEWVRDYPSINPARARGDLPKYIHVLFHEDHNLAVPHQNDIPFTSSAGSGGTTHGLVTRQVFKLLGGYYYWDEALRVYGYSPNNIGLGPRQLLHSPNWYGTELYVKNSFPDAEKRFTLYIAVTESERYLYAVTHARLNDGFAGAWANIEMGWRDASGILFARKAVGDWTELFDKIVPPAAAYDASGGLGQNWVTKAPVPLVEVHSATTKIVGNAEPRVGEITPSRRAILSVTRNAADAAPFNPAWKQRENGIFALELDKRRVKVGSDALIGRPQFVPVLNVERPNGPGFVGKAKQSTYQKYLETLGLRIRQKREDLVWDMDYTFWIIVNARRMYPNSKARFWTEKVKAFSSGTVDHIELEADDRVVCRRDYVDYITPNVAGTTEKNRPNGNDGYGRCLNKEQLRAEAFRRARLKIIELTEPLPWSHDFLAYDKLPDLTLDGSMDSASIKVDGWLIRGELAMGRRASEMAQRDEAMIRATNQGAEVAGKRLRR